MNLKRLSRSIIPAGFWITTFSAVEMPAGAQEKRETAAQSPEVTEAARKVYEWLEYTPISEAKTIQQIERQFPNLKHHVIEAALNELVADGRLKRLGRGTSTSPYKYYERQQAGG